MHEWVKNNNWHAPFNVPGMPDEVPCGEDEWRTIKRNRVVKMRDMDDRHLNHAIRFATTKPHHACKLEALLHELVRRMSEGATAHGVNEEYRQLAETRKLEGGTRWLNTEADTPRITSA